VDVFVINMLVAGYGINFHNCCHTGIVIGSNWNQGNTDQVINRLIRLGQTKPVRWYLLRITDSFNSVQEAIAMRKWVRQLCAEGAIPEYIKGNLRLVYAYELARARLRQPWNRYA
jgi:hypothetical protein